MRISEVLRRKGSTVSTVAPQTTIGDLIEMLADQGIGSVVVSASGGDVAGIVSERDVVRGLREQGGDLLAHSVESIMTTNVHTCTPNDDLETLALTMTEHRIRYLPVVVDGELRGIVSIGDIVKARLSLLEDEKNALLDYVNRGG